MTRGSSRPLDLERHLERTPRSRENAEVARRCAEVGELVRRRRTDAGLSLAELAARVGTSAAHLSELERGLGVNGPTIGMLTRIFRELGDDLVIAVARAAHAEDAQGRALPVLFDEP